MSENFHRDERRLYEPYKAFQDQSPKRPPPKPFWTLRKIAVLAPLSIGAFAAFASLVCFK